MTGPRSLLVAGAQKSCSTSLARLLDRHPDIRMLRREVVAFEDPYYPAHLPRLHAHIRGSHAGGAVPALKRPELLHRPEASRRARQHLPDPLVIVVLREPVSRTLSAYHHYVHYGLLPAVHPDVGLAPILQGWCTPGPPQIHHQVVRYSLYAPALARLRREFEGRLLVFYQEELLEDIAACTGAILRALALPGYDLGALPKVNRGSYSLAPTTPARLAGRIGYEIDPHHTTFAVTRRPLRRKAGQALFLLDRLVPRRASPPALSPAVRTELARLFADDATALGDVVGRPVPHQWKHALRSPSPTALDHGRQFDADQPQPYPAKPHGGHRHPQPRSDHP